MTQQLLYQPYTYYISWTHLDVHYYGVRWSEEIRGLKPEEDLWINYFTSSKKVEEFREKHGEPDRIKICQRFDNAKDARLWEEKFLRRVNVINEDRWLNQSCSDGNFAFTYHTEKSKQKMSRSWDKRRVKHPVTDETRQKMSKGIKEYYSKPEKREAASKRTAELWQDKDFRERMLASRNTPESKAKHSKALKEYYRNNPEAKEKQSERQKEHYQNHPETRVKISEAIKGRIWITDGNNTKMISGNDSIPDGWRKGRK